MPDRSSLPRSGDELQRALPGLEPCAVAWVSKCLLVRVVREVREILLLPAINKKVFRYRKTRQKAKTGKSQSRYGDNRISRTSRTSRTDLCRRCMAQSGCWCASQAARRGLAAMFRQRRDQPRNEMRGNDKNQEPAVAHASGLRGGAATLLSSRQLGLLPGERNSKNAASATTMIGRGVEIVNYGSMLSPLSTAAERPTVAVIYHREEDEGRL
jgi:hypothetical protein